MQEGIPEGGLFCLCGWEGSVRSDLTKKGKYGAMRGRKVGLRLEGN
jgi:hypothetical protein